jgi:hypothetical protein
MSCPNIWLIYLYVWRMEYPLVKFPIGFERASCMGSINTTEFLNANTYSIRTVTFLMKIQVLWDVTVSLGKQFEMFWMTVVPSTQCHISDDLYLQPHLYDNLQSYIFNAYNLVVIQFECMCSPVVSALETFVLKFMAFNSRKFRFQDTLLLWNCTLFNFYFVGI